MSQHLGPCSTPPSKASGSASRRRRALETYGEIVDDRTKKAITANILIVILGGGNGWEHFANGSPANGKEATGSPGEPEGEAS